MSMAIELTGGTLWLNGVAIGGVGGVRIETPPEPERDRPAFQGLAQGYRWQGRITVVDPRFYRWMTGRNHPRIRRMHGSYRQRRRGRW
jgi:hypothetical protein